MIRKFLGRNFCVKREKMKTIVRKLALLVLALSLALSLVGCFGGVDSEGKCTVVVGTEGSYVEYEVPLDEIEGDDGLMALLRYLNENKGLVLDYTDSAYGAMLNKVGNLTPDAMAGEYIKVFTSNALDFDTSTFFEEITYGGRTLGASGLGASSMTISDGGVYLLTIGSF